MIKFDLPYPDNCSECVLRGKACRRMWWVVSNQDNFESMDRKSRRCPILESEDKEVE